MADLSELKRTRGSKQAILTKLYKDLEKNMVSYENVEHVGNLFEKLCERFEQFKSVHFECLDACTESSVVEQLEGSFESCRQNFEEFRERISQWMEDSKSKQENISDDASSIVSRATTRSTTSSRSSVSKIKSAKAKRLVAEHKLKKLKEKQELERARNELEMKQQLIEQESEIEEAKIEESVWEESYTEEAGEVFIDNSKQYKPRDKNSVDSERQSTSSSVMNNNNSGPEERRSDVSVSSIETAFQRIASSLHEGFNLPKPELLTFNGNPINYIKFIKNFETNIDSKISDNQVKLSYLIQYCKGEARDSIEDCVLLDYNEGYSRARTILQSRYGRPHIIARSYVNGLVYGAQIKASNVDELSKLALEMQKCEMTLSKLGFCSDIDNSENLRRIVKRLPMHMKVKWVEIAHNINESGREPRFSDLTKFVEEKSRIATSMYGYDLCSDKNDNGYTKSKHGSNDKTNAQVVTLSTQSQSKTDIKKQACNCCSGTCVDLVSCSKFKTMSLNDRYKLVRRLKLCYNCLKGKHFSHDCRKPSLCTVSGCTYKHNLLLHSWVQSDQTAIGSSVNCAETKGAIVRNCLGIIPVNVKGGNGNSCRTYALLDDRADKTLCDERLLSILNIPSRQVTFKMSTVSSSDGVIHGREVDLHVSSVNSTDKSDISLRKVWSVKTLPISTKSAARNQDIENLPYLADIQIPEVELKDVMLVIGTDSPLAHIPLEVRSGDESQPYAVRSRLGWTIRGPIRDTNRRNEANVNFGASKDILLQQQLERMWKTYLNDRLHDEKACMSIEDKQAMKIMESTLEYKDGHYMMGLPWRKDDISLPNNIALALARLQQLKNKLLRDDKLHEMYTKTVSDYIDKGYATEVENIDVDNKRVWYLPHHPVTNENKPGKVRVVFDCAAKYQDTSLNSQILQGPDLVNNLVGVLLRFRQDRVAIAADIEAMFHQVKVQKEDCDALRFLWWPDGNLDKKPKHCCMQVHLFGATSSPSCAAFALKRTATDHSHLYDKQVITTVDKNFYVDDCLKSVPTVENAVRLAADLQSLMKLGGFRLTKWISNSRQVIEAIPQTELAPSIVSLNPDDALPNDKALGIIWDVNLDRIKFRVNVAEKPYRRRGILSTVSSMFDPLGLISPVTLKAKTIIQSLCKAKIGWDDSIPQNQAEQWRDWLQKLSCLENVSVNRCFKSDYFKESVSSEVHLFSDGSETGYGACAYLRQVDVNDNITCSLVIEKARLAPIKQMTIPNLKLELSGL